MRICILEGDMSRKGGTERMAAWLSGALSARHTVWVVSLRLNGGEVFFPLDPAVTHVTLSSDGSIPGSILAIRRFLRENRIDRVINVDTGMALYGVPAAWGTGAKVITWEHSNFFNNWGSRAFPHIRRFAARRSHAMVVLTGQDEQNYRGHISRIAPVHIIPNPADPCDCQYDSTSTTILSAGLLVPGKRFDRVIELAKRLLPSRPDWQWVICGDGPEREWLEQAVDEAGLSGRVLLPGTVRDMDGQYRSAAMFVMTSEMEGLPMVLLEARAHALPLVSFDIETGPRDIITDGVNGWLVPPFDLDCMEEKIAALMDSEALRRRHSSMARPGLDAFSRERVAEKWEEVLSL